MVSKLSLRLVLLMERNGRRLESRSAFGRYFVTLWDGERIDSLGFGRDINDAIVRCAKMRVKAHPIGDLVVELTRQQQRANIKAAKSFAKATGFIRD